MIDTIPALASAGDGRRGESIGYIGTQRHQLQKIAAVQGQVVNALLLNHGAHRSAFRGQHFAGGADFNGLRRLPHRESKIHARRLLHLQFNARAQAGLEAGSFHFYVVLSRIQRRKAVYARTVGTGGSRGIGL